MCGCSWISPGRGVCPSVYWFSSFISNHILVWVTWSRWPLFTRFFFLKCQSKCQTLVTQHWQSGEGKLTWKHNCWTVVQAGGKGGGGQAQCRSSRKRSNLSATRAMTVTITTAIKQHSSVYNALWRSRSIAASTAAAANSSPACLWGITEANAWISLDYKNLDKVQFGGYRSGGTDDSPLAVNLWWFWSFSPSPLWEIWSKGGKEQTKKRGSSWRLFISLNQENVFDSIDVMDDHSVHLFGCDHGQ